MFKEGISVASSRALTNQGPASRAARLDVQINAETELLYTYFSEASSQRVEKSEVADSGDLL
jgi:hypothetical protein